MQFEITRLSSKGQFVIPGKVRKLLGLRTGTKLAMFHDGESIFLKPIPAPDIPGFRKLAKEAKKTALNAKKKTGAKK
ncbi:MAG: AbrB/MazE/SpoVT family DNA-binding domain-containing protein [Spartobacteria bacterium]|nr:AbrB/MazE/SpoVT family DNA-binding domain-containing protein [Spartobacteria bacterium]